jgi:NitT/TauT family transport system substrate-binding protein
MSSDFIASKPDVAKRFAAAWAEAIAFIKKNPDEARKYLAHNTLTPDDLVDQVPMLGYTMIKDMTPKQMDELQKFVDFGTEIGVVPEKVDVTKFITPF